jgi:hypothetical protein
VTKHQRKRSANSGADALEALAKQALDVAKKARRHRQNLANENFYGNRLATLRADATNCFRDLAAQSAGDTTAMAELIQAVFEPTTTTPARVKAMRELVFSLRTTWKQANTGAAQEQSGGLFPLTLLSQAKRGYLVSVGTQMNGCFDSGWYDASAVMMRRLVEISIIEAFEHKGIAQKIKAADDNYRQLSDLVSIALNEPALSLSRNAKKFLPQLRDVGHMSAHGRFFHAQKEDLDKVQIGFRVVVEELLRHAALL